MLAVFAFLISRPRQDSGKLQVFASFYPLYYFSQEIGKDKADVINITPTGAEPHEYEISPQDMARIEKADMLVLSGVGLEAWDALSENIVLAGQGLGDGVDPHIWLSPKISKDMVENIEKGYVLADPENEDYYEENLNLLQQRLITLDQEFSLGLINCRKDIIITSHSAFGYLAKEYGFTQLSIAGLSPEEEPSLRQLAGIVSLAREKGIKYVFAESLESPRLAETLSQEIGAGLLMLNPLEGLDGDRDYFTEMRNNLANLRIALECQ